jgi:hypothetical protein
MTAMTDRELLELAAKAVGLLCAQAHDDDHGCEVTHFIEGKGRCIWSPLTDDGDALRLAVKLGLLVDADIEEGESDVIALGVSAREPHGHNPCAATRRAIVRAAAAIGAQS